MTSQDPAGLDVNPYIAPGSGPGGTTDDIYVALIPIAVIAALLSR